MAVLLVAAGAHGEHLHIVAASEMRLEPRVPPDRASLEITVRLRDDRGAPIRGPVRLAHSVAGERYNRPVRLGESDATGHVAFVLPVAPSESILWVRADFDGDGDHAPAQAEAWVDLDAPFVALDLSVPAVIDLRSPPTRVLASLEIGEVVAANPAGWEIALSVDDHIVATALSDATGRAEFLLPSTAFGGPGVRAVRAKYERAGLRVESPVRRVVLRSRTSLTLARVDQSEEQPRLVGALATSGGPVVQAPIRLLAAGRVVGAALTGARGSFEIVVDPDLVPGGDALVVASFVPTEPWFEPSRSSAVRVGRRSPQRVPWPWVALPVAVAVAFAAVLRARQRASDSHPERIVPRGPASNQVAIEAVRDAADERLRVRLRVLDHASGEALPSAQVFAVDASQVIEPVPDEIVLARPGRVRARVVAEGYAPLDLDVDFPRGGTYTLRVSLRSWREELFDRARHWIGRARAGGEHVPPTPREALALRGDTGEARKLVELVESGAYGPDGPDASVVRTADAHVAALKPTSGSVDAKN